MFQRRYRIGVGRGFSAPTLNPCMRLSRARKDAPDKHQSRFTNQSSGGGGANTSRFPLDSSGPTTPERSICSTIRAARL
uniref:Uncharacterized protein n=1 Tax=Candidatus Kentrum sp. DK TaxID=2126562 RepID=A0A450SIP5_9GAMM|nr:MAG: hypothetical protein BECKDK2373B_GA0170837_104133 [Candidatus Kentron sp. DK]